MTDDYLSVYSSRQLKKLKRVAVRDAFRCRIEKEIGYKALTTWYEKRAIDYQIELDRRARVIFVTEYEKEND